MTEQNRFQKTGIYLRLSRDDEKAGESTSIERQRIILQTYVAERGGAIVDEYVDDGWSGTNFDRPAVKRMLSDAQSGRIDTIVVKDLSRFGRNYIQVGQYIDYIFPAYGIRFIALNDNVDTADRSSAAMDMMPIMNVFNEWHAANTSKKIRAVLDASRRSGKYTNWAYPYGYRAGTDGNRTAVVDEEAAKVVKRIFGLRAEGNSSRTIARILTDEGVPNPATYFTRLDGGKWDRPCSPYWCPSTVAWILSNPIYIGYTVQHKTASVSYKNHKVVSVPQSERIVKENAHEAIVSRALWDKVQDVNGAVSRGKTDKLRNLHALSGLLVCSDCGKKLKYRSSKSGTGYFDCRTYVDLGKKYCPSHRVSEREMESVILRDVRFMLGAVTVDGEKAREAFIKGKAKHNAQNRCSDEKQLKACRNRLSELEKLIQSAFEEKVLGNLPENVCADLCNRYQKERTAVEEQSRKIEKRLSEADKDEDEAEEYAKRLKAYCNFPSLTREACLQLIDFVTVGKKNETDGEREVHIYYRFQKG